jgi:hypothetical protein
LSKRNARDATVENKHEAVDAISGDIGRCPIGPGHGGLMVSDADRSKYGKFRPRCERPAPHGDSAMSAVNFDHQVSPTRETCPLVKLGGEICC